jgi:hypothetical protein
MSGEKPIRKDQAEYRKAMQDMDERIQKKVSALAEEVVPDGDEELQKVFASLNLKPLFKELEKSTIAEILAWYTIAQQTQGIFADPPKNYAERFWTDDGLNLSDRMQKASQVANLQIRKQIRQDLKAHKGAIAIAKQIKKDILLGKIESDGIRKEVQVLVDAQKLGEPVEPSARLISDLEKAMDLGDKSKVARSYEKLIKALEIGDDERIKKAMRNVIEQKAGYVARRIARTESARAYMEGMIVAQAKNKESGIVGYEWNLSSGRSFGPDICDVFASADFGWGKGVFPKDQLPQFPAHPNCMCFLIPIFDDEIPKNAKFDFEKGGDQFLANESEATQKQILGIGKQEKFTSGEKWYNLLTQYGKPTTLKNPLEGIKKAQRVGEKQDLFVKEADFLQT